MRNWNMDAIAQFGGSDQIASLPMRNWNSTRGCRPRKGVILRAYLWGIETCCSFNSCCTRIKLRAYLWGIETKLNVETFLTFVDCEPTYEELKLIPLSKHRPLLCYCEPTYEELKPFLYSLALRLCGQIASLPMRNWNMKNPEQNLAKIKDCEPTYEELKLIPSGMRQSSVENCEPTYEELKLESQACPP